MHADDGIGVVPVTVHGELVVPGGDTPRPAREVGGRAQLHRDTRLLQLRPDVVGAGGEAVRVERRDIENRAEAHTVRARRETGFVEQRPGALQVKPVFVQPVAVEGARVVQRAVPRAGQASMQRVHHELPVDGVGDSLANPQVVEGRSAQVELDIVDRAERFVARLAHVEIGIVPDPQNVAETQAGKRVIVHFARLQREHARRRLLEKPDDDPV